MQSQRPKTVFLSFFVPGLTLRTRRSATPDHPPQKAGLWNGVFKIGRFFVESFRLGASDFTGKSRGALTGISRAGCILGASLCAWLGTVGARAADLAIFAPDQPRESIQVLSDMLGGHGANRVQIASELDEALEAKADALVLWMDRHANQPVCDPKALAALRARKIVGIGYGAAMLFKDVGLVINAGECAHFSSPAAKEIRLESDLGESNSKGEVITALVDGEGARGSRAPADLFAMYLPAKDERTHFVEAIARLQRDLNYAPIVKQGNYVMVGLTASPSEWTREYRSVFAALVGALAKQPLVPFSKPQWATSAPGKSQFELAQTLSVTELCRRTFRFRFTKPTVFSASLEHSGSASVMLFFSGEKGEHRTRKDSNNGSTLQIEVAITEEDIRAMGEGYWELSVTNFDSQARAGCKLAIHY